MNTQQTKQNGKTLPRNYVYNRQTMAYDRPIDTPAQASGNCQTSHSPLPWSVVDNGMQIIKRDGYMTGSHMTICKLPMMIDESENPDAAFIVRACNHAQRLADTLQRIQADAGIGMDYDEIAEVAGEALAQYNESPADAIEALDQLEQLEGGE